MTMREEMFYLIIWFNFIDNDGSMHMISDSIACTLEVHVDDMHHGPGCFHVYILFILQISNNKLESYNNNSSTIILGRTLHAHLYHLSFFHCNRPHVIPPACVIQPVWYKRLDCMGKHGRQLSGPIHCASDEPFIWHCGTRAIIYMEQSHPLPFKAVP